MVLNDRHFYKKTNKQGPQVIKNEVRRIIGLIITATTIKSVEENTGKTSLYLWVRQGF